MDLPSICVHIPNKLQGYKVIYSGLLAILLPGRREPQLLQATMLPDSKTIYS